MKQEEFDFPEITVTSMSGIDTITLTNSLSMADYTSISPSAGTYSIPNVYTTNGTGDYIFPSTTYETITLNSDLNGSTLKVNGDADIDGDLKVKGKSIVDSLEKIEEKLAILHPNIELEERWDQLRELRKQYMELEREIIEKEKVWNILKK